MSKTKKTPKAAKSAAKKPTMRWMLGVFTSASSGELIAAYCRTDGSVAPMYSKTVRTKKALFAAKYVGVTYKQAREALMRDAAKAGVKEPPKREEKKNGGATNPKLRRAA